MGVSWLFLVYSKEVVRVFQKGCKGIEKVVSKVFKASFKVVSISKVLLENVKGVLREL